MILALLALAAAAAGPPPWFTDATEASGIPSLRHAEGVNAFDLDADGLPELFLPNIRGENRLFRNLGGGRFRDATAEAGLGQARGGVGAVFADFDGDGRADLLVVRGADPYVAPNLLYRGQPGGRFADVSQAAGLSSRRDGISATAADFDGDGVTDAFVAGWGANHLYRASPRAGVPALEDVTAAAGLGERGRSWGALATDVNGDGLPDLFVARGQAGSREGCRLFVNRGRGVFEDRTSEAGLGGAPWSMSAASADFDGDGDLDLYVASFEGPGRLYLNDGRGRFADATEGSGLTAAKCVGAAAGMIDGDLLPDLVVAGFAGPVRAYRNLGGGRFADLGDASGLGSAAKNDGLALADVEGDGDLDLYVANFEGKNRLYLNNLERGPFLKVRFAPGRAPKVGALARLYRAGRRGRPLATLELQAASGLGQGPEELLFRLPGEGPFDLSVLLPGGKTLERTGVRPGVLALDPAAARAKR